MQTRGDSADREKQREQLYALRMLLEEALHDNTRTPVDQQAGDGGIEPHHAW